MLGSKKTIGSRNHISRLLLYKKSPKFLSIISESLIFFVIKRKQYKVKIAVIIPRNPVLSDEKNSVQFD